MDSQAFPDNLATADSRAIADSPDTRVFRASQDFLEMPLAILVFQVGQETIPVQVVTRVSVARADTLATLAFPDSQASADRGFQDTRGSAG